MLDRSEAPSQGPNTSDYVYATYYTSTFSTFMQSNPVINKAVNLLDKPELSESDKLEFTSADEEIYKNLGGLKISRSALSGAVRVVTQEDSLIITITASVADKNPESGKARAIDLANATLLAAKTEANRAENGEPLYSVFYNNLIVMEYANEYTVSESNSGLLLTIVFMLLGAALSFGIILIKYLLDDTYTSQESFEKAYGINVLSIIPEILEANDGGKK